jgi:DNA-binding transcriptional regulator YiaG
MPSGCSQAIRGNYFLPGTFAVLIVTAAAAYPGTSPVVEAHRLPLGTASVPTTMSIVSFGRRRQEEYEDRAVAEVVRADVAMTAADHVDAIQEALGLSITRISEIVGVERATVHNWMRRNAGAPAKPLARSRLLALYQLARQWAVRELPEPRRLLAAALDERGVSLIDLLRAETWDKAAIKRGMDRLARRMSQDLDRRAQARAIAELEAKGSPTPERTAAEIEAERVQVQLAVQRARRFGRRV